MPAAGIVADILRHVRCQHHQDLPGCQAASLKALSRWLGMSGGRIAWICEMKWMQISITHCVPDIRVGKSCTSPLAVVMTGSGGKRQT
jgi:hypothetical protein